MSKKEKILNKNNLTKHSGQVFTPNNLVNDMLDYCSYSGKNILVKHIIDNSCGDGAFLCSATQRYCDIFLKSNHNIKQLANNLSKYIHGIELDTTSYNNCIFNLNTAIAQYGIKKIKWDIRNKDALSERDFDGKMDFVVGNPPYVRVHNLGNIYNSVKEYKFANGGMTDLYLAFFELGFKMMNNSGKLCYITPSSWLNSLAAKNMRTFILQHKKLIELINLGHYQPFKNITTYTLISLFDNLNTKEKIKYYTYDDTKHFNCELSYEDISINHEFYLSSKENLQKLKAIKDNIFPKLCTVKNGFATLADNIFIRDLPFTDMTIDVIKASTSKWYKAFYPYDENGRPYAKDEIFSHKDIAKYLNEHKKILLKGKTEEQKPDWYLYGRTQALQDVYVNKLAINTIVKDINSIKTNIVPSGCGLFSGIYVICLTIDFEEIKRIIITEEFIEYISLLKKYKNGGYYTFSTKDLEQFLNYKLAVK